MSRIFWVVLAVSIGIIGLFAFGIGPWLHSEYGYFWTYSIPVWQRFWPFVLITIGYISLLTVSEPYLNRWQNKNRLILVAMLAGIVLVSIALQLTSLRLLNPNSISELYRRTVSPASGGYFNAALPIEHWTILLQNFTQLMPTWEAHPQRQPPGLPLLFVGWRALLDRLPMIAEPLANAVRLDQCNNSNLMYLNDKQLASAWIGMTLPVLSAGVLAWPIYVLGKAVYGFRVGWQAAALTPLIPTLNAFTPSANQIYPIVTLLALGSFWYGLVRQKSGWVLVAGILMSVSTFLSFANLIFFGPLALLSIIMLANQYRQGGVQSVMGLLIRLMVFAVGVGSIWGLYWLYTGITPLDIWQIANQFHFSIDLPYGLWIWLNLQDFFNYGGWVLAGLALGGFVEAAVRLRFSRSIEMKDYLPLIFGCSLLFLAFSGLSQGEVARVWSPYVPLMILVAAAVLANEALPKSRFKLVTIILAINLMVIIGFMNRAESALDNAPLLPPIVPVANALPIDANFANMALLEGYQLTEAPNTDGQTTMTVTLNWRAITQFSRPFHVFVHLIVPDGTRIAQSDTMPSQMSYPTTCWRPGQRIGDPHTLHLPDNAPSGDYALQIGMFLLDTGERLAVYDNGAPTQDFVQVDGIVVSSKR